MQATTIYPADYPNWFRNRYTARPGVRRLALRAKMFLKGSLDGYLRNVSDLVHLGANVGEERFVSDANGLRVTWIEANPAVFVQLQANLAGFPQQRALQALITDEEGTSRRLFIANGSGSASSVFERKLHRELFPEIEYEGAITLATRTLPALLATEHIELRHPTALVMDIQGAELLALRGALPILEKFTFIKTEAADIEVYAGGCLEREVDAFLQAHHFAPIQRKNLTRRPDGGGLCDILYRRQS